MKYGARLFALAWLLAACTHYRAALGSYTAYPMGPSPRHSPRYGFPVDDPRGEVDLARLDDITGRVLACLQQFQARPMTPAERTAAACDGYPDPVLRSYFAVVVAPDWHVSPCSGEQIFPCRVPVVSCTEKGLPPDAGPACPCSCRAIVQDDRWVVTTPNLRLYAGQLTSLLTGCTNAWVGRLTPCAATW